MLKNNWLIFKDIDELSQRLLEDILLIAQESIQLNDCFKIVLTGGTSITHLYQLLSNAKSQWKKWHIYIGDERCLPLKDKDRNDSLINNIWLSRSLIPKENINFIHAELVGEIGSLEYEKILENVEFFDVVLLSMGEDGHIASLFPGREYDKDKSVLVESNSPKYPKNRITMTYQRLNKSNNVFKIINGRLKQDSVELWLNGQELPVGEVSGLFDRVYCCKNAIPHNISIGNG